jgi:hypothetical protein
MTNGALCACSRSAEHMAMPRMRAIRFSACSGHREASIADTVRTKGYAKIAHQSWGDITAGRDIHGGIEDRGWGESQWTYRPTQAA